jgi:hypothetical protein
LRKYPFISQKFRSYLQIDYQRQKTRTFETIIGYCYYPSWKVAIFNCFMLLLFILCNQVTILYLHPPRRLDAAEEFLKASRINREKLLLRPMAENLFAAIELCIVAQMLLQADKNYTRLCQTIMTSLS